MDNISFAVLDKIAALGSGYKIISEDELLECFPEGAERTRSELKKAILKLNSEGFVDVKYSDGNMYCVTALKSYVPEPEAEPAPPAQEVAEDYFDEGFDEVYTEQKTNFLPVFAAAFLGGALGSLLVSLIFALVNA